MIHANNQQVLGLVTNVTRPTRISKISGTEPNQKPMGSSTLLSTKMMRKKNMEQNSNYLVRWIVTSLGDL